MPTVTERIRQLAGQHGIETGDPVDMVAALWTRDVLDRDQVEQLLIELQDDGEG